MTTTLVFQKIECTNKLAELAQKVRIDVLEMVYGAQSGHLGGSFSAAEILVTLYYNRLNVDPENPSWPDRDRFVPEGHAAPALYVVLAGLGFFPARSWPPQADRVHPAGTPRHEEDPWREMSTGSLGQGLSTAVGMALAAQLDGKDYRVWCCWATASSTRARCGAAAFAAGRGLSNLTAIVDYNKVQLDGPTVEVLPMEPVADKWRAFGWHVVEADGHCVKDLLRAYDEAVAYNGGPTVILAHTVKGKGVSFMEGQAAWHGAAPNAQQYEQAMKELRRDLECSR